MKLGTPGFIGDRLREAREARGLTGIALADLIGVTRAAVSQYEAGQGSPSPDVMRKISGVLDLPIRFYVEPRKGRRVDLPFFRSMSSATKAARTRARRRFDWLLDIVELIGEFVRLPQDSVPDFSPPDDPLRLGEGDIRALAIRTRQTWGLGLGPIGNVTWLLENRGIIVSRYGLGADELDAFSDWDGSSRPYVILNSEKNSAARSRFDVGHELGHLVLHRNVDRHALAKGEHFKLIENQAHLFAGEFLLPAETFAADLYRPTIEGFRSLQYKWKVSIAFMIKRARTLGLISETQQAALYRNLTRRGWRTREPFDDEAEAEIPRFLRRAIETMVGRGVIAAYEIPFRLCLNPRDVEVLACLPSGYFDSCSTETPVTAPREGDAHQRPADTEHGISVIRFPGVG